MENTTSLLELMDQIELLTGRRLSYVLDERSLLESRCNLEMVAITELRPVDDGRLRKLLHQHFQKTGSARARAILARWEAYRTKFRKVAPPLGAVIEPVVHLQSTGSPA